MAPPARRLDPGLLPRVRARSQLLHRPAATAVEAVALSAGIQAQEPYAARLGIRARARGLTVADVERAREERAVLRDWVMRGTLHLVPAEDADWLLPLWRDRELRWSQRRLSRLLGLDRAAQDRAVERIRRLLASEGQVTRGEVLAALQRGGIDASGQNAVHHLARLAVLTGIALLGPERSGKTTYVGAREWLGPLRPVPRERALEELARRHLRAFAPADERDLAAWSGLGLRECRAALERIGGELLEVRVGDRSAWALRAHPPRPARSPQVRLLPPYDNHLMGHSSRDIAVPAEHVERVWPGAGIVRATVLRDGIAVATWGMRRESKGHRITVEPFAPLDDAVATAIRREALDVGRFEGAETTLEEGGG